MNSVQIPPGSFMDAAEANMPAFQENLTRGSDWMKLIVYQDIPKRKNSPYYGPATQFIVDNFLYIADRTPELTESAITPLERVGIADFLIRNYLAKFLTGNNGILAHTYAASDVSRTQAHLNRFGHLQHDTNHILQGAIVPFDDIARTGGGAALSLFESGNTAQTEIPNVIAKSKKLQIIGGLDGTRTPQLSFLLGHIYVESKHFLHDGETVTWTSEALEILHPFLSKVGCPTAKIKNESGTQFNTYWNKLVHFLLDSVDYEKMQLEQTTAQ